MSPPPRVGVMLHFLRSHITIKSEASDWIVQDVLLIVLHYAVNGFDMFRFVCVEGPGTHGSLPIADASRKCLGGTMFALHPPAYLHQVVAMTAASVSDSSVVRSFDTSRSG